jgi:curli biogenesis system outer membrane secretion channel CsgG
MRYRWFAALCAVVMLSPGPAARADGLKGLLHRGDPKMDPNQVNLCVQERAWMAYFKDGHGALAPVRDTLNTDRDGDWLGLRFTDYDGPRIRLGVLAVINKSAEAEDRGGYGRIEVPVAGIQEMLTVALYNTKRFDVIEQKRIKEIEHQQTRTDVVEPSPASIVNIGKVLGAQYLVYGTVNEWTPERSNRAVATNGFASSLLNKIPIPGVGTVLSNSRATKKEAEVAVTFTLADVATGQILYTTAQRAKLGEWNVAWGISAGVDSATSQKTPVTYAITACTNKAAFEIARFLRDRKWKGSVVDIAKADVFINAGSQQGMAPQTILSVQKVDRIIVDRESRTVLGEATHGIGSLEVISVQPTFSVARVHEGCDGIKAGDRVELATPPAPVATRPECAALEASLAR